MKHLAKIIVLGIAAVQMSFGAITVPDIEPNIGEFGPKGGWSKEELQIFEGEGISLPFSQVLYRRFGTIYPDIGKVLSKKTITSNKYIITGIDQQNLRFIYKDKIIPSMFITYKNPFKKRSIGNMDRLSNYRGDFQLTPEGDIEKTTFTWEDDFLQPYTYTSQITYKDRKPISLIENSNPQETISYLSNGSIDIYQHGSTTEKYSYNQDGRIEKITNGITQKIYTWQLLSNGDLSRKIELQDISTATLKIDNIDEIHFNQDNNFTYWSSLCLSQNYGYRGVAEYNKAGRIIEDKGESLDSTKNWQPLYSSYFAYNSSGDLEKYTHLSIYSGDTTTATTQYEYNSNRWPISIIKVTQSANGIFSDTTNISYSDVSITSQATSKENKTLSIASVDNEIQFSRSLAKGSELTLFTLNGREITHVAIAGTRAILPSLSSGLFIWKVEEQGVITTGQLMIQ